MSCVLREFPSSTYNKYASDENSCAALLIEKNLIPEPETAKIKTYFRIDKIQFGRANVAKDPVGSRLKYLFYNEELRDLSQAFGPDRWYHYYPAC